MQIQSNSKLSIVYELLKYELLKWRQINKILLIEILNFSVQD